jgi:hypothetical protein
MADVVDSTGGRPATWIYSQYMAESTESNGPEPTTAAVGLKPYKSIRRSL